MTDRDRSREAPETVKHRLRAGSWICLDTLSAEELAAAQHMLLTGEAEIVSLACRPHVVRRLDRVIAAH